MSRAVKKAKKAPGLVWPLNIWSPPNHRIMAMAKRIMPWSLNSLTPKRRVRKKFNVLVLFKGDNPFLGYPLQYLIDELNHPIDLLNVPNLSQ